MPALTEQLTWLEKKLPENWLPRIIVSRDKSLLMADYLIDVQPNPLESYDLFKKRGTSQFARPVVQQPLPWKLILLDRPFNLSVPSSIAHARFPIWKQWTSGFHDVLNIDLRETIVSFAHGSSNSLDQDRMYIFPLEHINTVIGDRARALLDDGIIDVNLVDFDEDGYVCENHKGQTDEIHNALLTTYPLHVQRFPLPTSMAPKIQRTAVLKYLTGMRRMFIRLTEVELTRPMMKESLRNHHPSIGPLTFDRVDFTVIIPITNVDHAKTFAFQMGQIMGLIDGFDLFTKNDIVHAYPELEPFIMRRREESLAQSQVLNDFRTAIQRKVQSMEIHVGPHHVGLLQVNSAQQADKTAPASWNALLEQCNGIVIDFKDLSILAYPPGHQLSSPPVIDWPRDPSTSSNLAILPSSEAISIGRESHGHIIASDRFKFDSPACIQVLRLVSVLNTDSWPWRSHYLFFEVEQGNGSLKLAAARSKFSHNFLSKERLEKLSLEMNLSPVIANSSSSSLSSSS
jgi:hypothetical protein